MEERLEKKNQLMLLDTPYSKMSYEKASQNEEM